MTRLKLETSENLVAAHFVLLDSASWTSSDEDFGGDAKACGLDFNLWN